MHRLVCSELTASVHVCVGEGEGVRVRVRVRVRVGLAVPESPVFLIGPQVKWLLPERESVCVCVCERERERERHKTSIYTVLMACQLLPYFDHFQSELLRIPCSSETVLLTQHLASAPDPLLDYEREREKERIRIIYYHYY